MARVYAHCCKISLFQNITHIFFPQSVVKRNLKEFKTWKEINLQLWIRTKLKNYSTCTTPHNWLRKYQTSSVYNPGIHIFQVLDWGLLVQIRSCEQFGTAAHMFWTYRGRVRYSPISLLFQQPEGAHNSFCYGVWHLKEWLYLGVDVL
jgi:hypothetical protein